MKSRPRSVENRVVDELNKIFVPYGLKTIERIPAPGRTGPDMTWNELKLAVDPKSWKSNPKSHKIPNGCYDHGSYITTKLSDLPLLLEGTCKKFLTGKFSKTVWKLLLHLDEWREEYLQEGVSIIVLHWPNTRISNSVVVVKKEDIARLQNNFKKVRNTLLEERQ